MGRVGADDSAPARPDDLREQGMSGTSIPLEVRLWHDDIRPAPKGWAWVRTNDVAKILLKTVEVTHISLDHDLGLHEYTVEEIEANPELLMGMGQGEETGLDLVNWMCEHDLVPPNVTIHSWNPAGAQNMAARLNHFGHHCTVEPYVLPKRG